MIGFVLGRRTGHLAEALARILRHRGQRVRIFRAVPQTPPDAVLFWGTDVMSAATEAWSEAYPELPLLPGRRPSIEALTERWAEAGLACPELWRLEGPDDLPDRYPLALYHGSSVHRVDDRQQAEHLFRLLRRRALPHAARALPTGTQISSIVVGSQVFALHARVGGWLDGKDNTKALPQHDALADEQVRPALIEAVNSAGLRWGVVEWTPTEQGVLLWELRTTPLALGAGGSDADRTYRLDTRLDGPHWESLWLQVATAMADEVLAAVHTGTP